METLDSGELNQILDRINGWIESCDSKVSTILSGMGVLAGILLATDYISKIISIFRAACEHIGVGSVAYLIISIASLIVLMCGALLLIGVLFARVNPEKFGTRGVKTDSILFFSCISKNKTLSKYRVKVNKCSREQLRDDLMSQIYICSLICDKKFVLYKNGLVLSIIGFSVFVLMMVIGVVAF